MPLSALSAHCFLLSTPSFRTFRVGTFLFEAYPNHSMTIRIQCNEEQLKAIQTQPLNLYNKRSCDTAPMQISSNAMANSILGPHTLLQSAFLGAYQILTINGL